MIQMTMTVDVDQAVQSDRSERKPEHSVTELVLSNYCGQSCDQLLLPMIAQISNTTHGWLTLFCDHPIDRKALEALGADTSKVRVVPSSICRDKLWLLWETIHCGSSDCVIGNCTKLSKKELAQLQNACQQGGCQTLLWRQAQ